MNQIDWPGIDSVVHVLDPSGWLSPVLEQTLRLEGWGASAAGAPLDWPQLPERTWLAVTVTGQEAIVPAIDVVLFSATQKALEVETLQSMDIQGHYAALLHIRNGHLANAGPGRK